MKISRLPSGSYTTQISIRDLDGKRHIKRFTGKTKREVQKTATDYQTAHSIYMDSDTLQASTRRFIDMSESSLSPSTIRAYKGIEKVLTNEYGDFFSTPLDRINHNQLQQLIKDLSVKKKPKTISNYIGLISAVMSSEGYRMPPVKIKQKERFDPHVPSAADIKKVAECAKDTRWEIPFALACMGLRRGEIAAVKASDLEGNVLHVSHAMVYTSDCMWEQKEPKTKQSDRYVPLPDRIADLIKEKGCAWEGSAGSLTHSFYSLIARSGVEPFRLHDCRHFFASYCHDVLKLSDAQIMKLGGWSTDHVMKRVYITSITNEAENVRDSIGNLLS